MASKPRVINGNVVDPRQNLLYYSRVALESESIWAPQDIRREYSRLRDIAQKRLKRLGESKFKTWKTYTRNADKYAPVRELTTAQARALLPDLAKFVAAKTGTVRGLRSARTKAVASLRAAGFEMVDEDNFSEFARMMDAYHKDSSLHVIGSEEYAEMVNELLNQGLKPDSFHEQMTWLIQHKEEFSSLIKAAEAKGLRISEIQPKDLEWYIKHKDTLEKLRPNEGNNAAEWRKKIEQYERRNKDLQKAVKAAGRQAERRMKKNGGDKA